MVLISAAVLGIGVGALYALASAGVIAIYRGSGILNLAHGGVGMAAAYLWWELHVQAEMPYGVAVAIAVLCAAALGAGIHLFLMRPLSSVSPLARIIATLAVLISLQAIVLLKYGPVPIVVSSELPQTLVRFGEIAVSWDRIVLFALALASTIGLTLLYGRTSFGRQTGAVAENPRVAGSLGISADRIAVINWMIGSAFAAVAAILVAPIVTLQVATMTSLMLAALAAALVAQLRSFGVAFVASILMGVAQSIIARYVTEAWVSQVVPFLLIVIVMIVRGQAIPLRDHVLERLPKVGSGRVSPVTFIVTGALLAALISWGSDNWAAAWSVTFAASVVMLSVVVISGYAGQLSLAQFALAGFGAFVQGRLAATTDLPPWLTVAIAIPITVVVGMALALPAIRTRGINLAIVTLGLGSALEIVVFQNSDFTGGFAGTAVQPSFFGISIDSTQYPHRYALLVLGSFLVAALFVANLRRGRMGRRLLAVRSNERAAAALGIDPRVVKLYAFGISAGIAALGGILIANRGLVMDFTAFTSFQSILYVGFAFLGGIGYIVGPVLGSFFVPGSVGTEVGDVLFADIAHYAGLIGGLSLIAVILMNHDGVASEMAAAWSKIRRRSTRRNRRSVRHVPVEDTVVVVEPSPLTIEGLSVRFGAVSALEDVSFSVQPGTVVGLIGPNGAGKTTLIDAVTGFVPAAAGAVHLAQTDITTQLSHARARAGLARSFQSLELFDDLTVYENLLAAAERPRWSDYVTSVVLPASQRLPDAVHGIIDLFGLGDELDVVVSDLSYGTRRLVAIARAVAAQPSVVMLDEPGAGLSQEERRQLGEMVRMLADRWGMAVLIVEHDTDFVMRVCDRVVVLDYGRKIAEGLPAEVRADPGVKAAYLGEESAEAISS